MHKGLISSLFNSADAQSLDVRGRKHRKSQFFQRHMPKARRSVMYARASTDEDILPRLSQQQRLFSNLDRSPFRLVSRTQEMCKLLKLLHHSEIEMRGYTSSIISNCDAFRSMKHEKGSVFGCTSLIAGLYWDAMMPSWEPRVFIMLYN